MKTFTIFFRKYNKTVNVNKIYNRTSGRKVYDN